MAKRQAGGENTPGLDFGHDQGIRSRVYTGTLASILLVGAFGGWAATAELSGAVIAAGQVKVDKDLRSIQHLDGGIIREIAVKKGDAIKAGQVLFRLDDTQTRAEMQIVRSQLTELLAKQARLVAERDGLMVMAEIADPLELGVNVSDAMRGETRLFKGNMQTRESQKKQLQLGIDQLDLEISALSAQSGANISELKLVQDESDKLQDLQRRKLIENNRVYSNSRDLTRLKGDKGNIAANIARSQVRKNELIVNLQSVDENIRTEAQKQHSEIEPRIAELKQRLGAIKDRLSRMEIRSPLSGTVNEISVNTIGGVITPAQKLLTIVPEDAKLQVEVRLQPSDIDQIYVGQESKIRFSAFTSRQTPELFGNVVFVSPATTSDQATGQVYYVAQLEIADSEYAKLQGKKLVPGMPVEAFVQTESRTALSYLAKPFLDQFTKAFREN
jgi:HlyD family type I secretion membrane fusion protein